MKVAVILSGCGFLDGAEINESVLSLLALSRAGATYQCMAPNINQHHVVNHVTGEPVAETRNVLVEAARIARGDIIDIAQAKPDDYDAVIIPGGYGAAKNLCDFAFKGADCTVNTDVLAFAQAMMHAAKPIGLICIAPAMVPRIYGAGAVMTIGNDVEMAAVIERMGAVHRNCGVRDCVIDTERKIVTTPAFMLANTIAEAADGIEKTVQAVLAMAAR